MKRVVWWLVLAAGLLGVLYFSWVVVQSIWLSATPGASIDLERRSAFAALLGAIAFALVGVIAATKIKWK